MHEVITLQFGQRSNYLATHFWNTQESYFSYVDEEESIVDHDIHFRPGIGSDGSETFTPRTVIYDMKGGFGSMRKINALYEIEESDGSQVQWNKPAVILQQTPIEKCTYQQNLEQDLQPTSIEPDTVRYWSDYNRVFFHPRSIVQLNEYEVGSAWMPFEKWSVGEELFKTVDKDHDIVERDLRPFIEEADQMQAIQILSSTDDAWGGFAARYLDQVRDEYGKTAVVFWGLEDSPATLPREKRYTALANIARSISEIVPETTLYTPITFPSRGLPSYFTLDQSSNWHVSALFSLAVESVTLPSRLKERNGSRQTLEQLEYLINTNGHQNIAKLRMSINHDELSNGSLNDSALHKIETSGQSQDRRLPLYYTSRQERATEMKSDVQIFDVDMHPAKIEEQTTSSPAKKTHVFSQYESHRVNSITQDIELNQKLSSERVRSLAAGLPFVTKIFTPLLFPLLDSFPRITNQTSAPFPLAVRTSLTVDTAVALHLKSLQRIANRIIAVDEREALSNSLAELAEAYEEGWDSGSDEGED